ncbi:retinol dehydrogenase 12-like isoform X2 [Bombus affinis]|uniref:Retinol dehydrogenase 12 isoform X2 n=1 Tax=Bombus terrestris TaxID=30195 RepID=A0A9C6SEM5_BOMTE|nr:retinol dehydrogenase 12 isoform X2 [Bombus terrestris]XP_050590944.1 retinol dehydrogenase 12-like isoform X2 [Bombus affinis]
MRFFSNYCNNNVRLIGKTVIITGANCGIGKETARDIYRRGARVILACRDINKATEAVNDIKETTSSAGEKNPEDKPGQLVICQLDLSSLTSVKNCAQHLLKTEPAIHILINNAGVFLHPFEKTENGFETHIQVNHLAHFLLTLLLLPRIIESGPGCRIINVSSAAHLGGNIHFEDLNLERSYSPVRAYCQSKLANILFTKELNKMLIAEIQGIHVYSLHPGVVKTELCRYMDASFFRGMTSIVRLIQPFMKTAEQGAQTTLYCAVDENAGKESGLYYDNCRTARPSSKACNTELATRLWKRSCELLGLPSEVGFQELLKTISNEEVEQ